MPASCASAPNTPVDRMWFASHGKLGDPDFAIYEEYDAVLSGLDPAAPISNQLVETVSAQFFGQVEESKADPEEESPTPHVSSCAIALCSPPGRQSAV